MGLGTRFPNWEKGWIGAFTGRKVWEPNILDPQRGVASKGAVQQFCEREL